MLKDPSGLGPKIRELQKKLLKAIEGTRSKSLDNLLAYTYFTTWEREMLMKNFDVLLNSLEDELKKKQKEVLQLKLQRPKNVQRRNYFPSFS